MGQTQPSIRRRKGRLLTAALLAFGLVAVACSKKDDGGTTANSAVAAATTIASAGSTAETAATTAGTTPADTTASDSTTVTTDSAPPATEPAAKPVPGGELIVSGEAEVANPWTPAAMQCDSYCQERARTFYDPVAALGSDNKVHPYLAETITPNAGFTEWTVKLRSGIMFTDGTPVNADAVIRNLQESGTSLLISKALVDVAKVKTADCGGDGQPGCALKITKSDDLTFVIFMGKGGDETQPLSWPGFDAYLAGQWGLIASPAYLDAAKADPTKAAQPVGSGPFIVQSYASRDALVVTKNPNYWQKDANGVQLPYLDKITFKVIEDSQTARDALLNGEINVFSTSNAGVIKDFRDKAADFPMSEQDKYVETGYLLINEDHVGPTQDARVRCALSMALDRQEMIDLVDGGILTKANGVFSPGQEGYLADNGFKVDQDIAGAKALIDAYKAETGATEVKVTYGHVPTTSEDQSAELVAGYWKAIGVTTQIDVVPQDQFITNALFGVDSFDIYSWRQHAGVFVDAQNFWWNSSAAVKAPGLALNFSRIRDDSVDANLAIARSDPDAAKRKAAAEAINKTFAKQCYQIPESFTLWGTPHIPALQGLATFVLPDGATAADGAGFSGQFWVNALWLKQG